MYGRGGHLNERNGLSWEELTEEEQRQARESYISLRATEEETDESCIDEDGVLCSRFERMPDGCIYVDL